ncbi:MAG: LysM peptidoglycan-binding domain-containing protein [Clostridia bacterium]|nr:LysM peptidoglycan-binding domain-containing protein [Clostridia bacterium]
MKSSFVAPVIKTLFVPDGNPDVQEVQNIFVNPRIRNSDANDAEITISGDMQIELFYRPMRNADDSLIWRKVEFNDLNETGEDNNEFDEENLKNLEESFRKGEDVSQEGNYKLNLEIPFTFAVDKEVMDKEDVLRVEPVVQNVNWMHVSPRAIEFEAVLKLERERNMAEDLPVISEEMRADLVLEPIEDQPVLGAVEKCCCQAKLEDNKTGDDQTNDNQTDDQEVEEKISNLQSPEIKQSYRNEQRAFFPSSGFYQMKFYRVQWGEDLDAIAERLGVAKEVIKTVNGISEEEIKTGMLLSIPK